jgi:hypothetical protein
MYIPPIIYRPESPEKSISARKETLPNFIQFFVFAPNTEYFAMDIISAREITNPSLLKFKIGGAALVFEKAEDWKHYFKNLIVRKNGWRLVRVPLLTVDLQLNACQAVRDNRARSTSREHLHLGNILYASLVSASSRP